MLPLSHTKAESNEIRRESKCRVVRKRTLKNMNKIKSQSLLKRKKNIQKNGVHWAVQLMPLHYFLSRFSSQAYINGGVHWIALDKSDVNCYRSLIVAFDIVVEVFRELVLPDSISGVSVVNMSIGTFQKSLVVYHPNKHPLNNHFTCSVWVMKEFGVAKSWVNQFNVELQGGLKNVQSLMKNSELLLGTTSGQLVLYNPKDQQMKDVEFYGPGTHSCYVDTYMESLVSCDAVTSQRKEDEICGSSAKQC